MSKHSHDDKHGKQKHDKQKIKAKATVGMEEVVTFLEDVLHNIRKGKLVFHQGDKNLSITTGDRVQLEVEVEHEHDEKEFSIELKWRDNLKDKGNLDIRLGSSKHEQPSHQEQSSHSLKPSTHTGEGQRHMRRDKQDPPECPESSLNHTPEVFEQAGCLPPFQRVENPQEVIFGQDRGLRRKEEAQGHSSESSHEQASATHQGSDAKAEIDESDRTKDLPTMQYNVNATPAVMAEMGDKLPPHDDAPDPITGSFGETKSEDDEASSHENPARLAHVGDVAKIREDLIRDES